MFQVWEAYMHIFCQQQQFFCLDSSCGGGLDMATRCSRGPLLRSRSLGKYDDRSPAEFWSLKKPEEFLLEVCSSESC